MSSIKQAPGVYIEEISVFPASVVEVETAIPAFIGYTYKDPPAGQAFPFVVRIQSLKEFEDIFGRPGQPDAELISAVVTKQAGPPEVFEVSVSIKEEKLPKHILYYALQMFFDNGGGPCYIAAVDKAAGNLDKDKLIAGVEKVKAFDEPTLLLVPEAVKTITYDDNGAIGDPGAYKSIMDKCISQAELLKDRFVIIDVPFNAKKKNIKDDADTFRGQSIGFYSKYAASYYPFLKTTLNYVVDINTLKFSSGDATYNDKPIGDFVGSAIYEKVRSEVDKQLRILLPPAGMVAGIYARVDNERGVWKAPANVTLNNVIGTSITISQQEQEGLNVDAGKGRSINAIRYVTGVGLTIWGARTLDGNSKEWRYVSIRRFFNMVEESVMKSTLWAVFEPNTKNTWVKVKSMIESYLLVKWIEGALAGSKPEEAFFVNVGLPETMSSDDVLEGIMRVKIGMAVSRPAEFIIIEFSHKKQTS